MRKVISLTSIPPRLPHMEETLRTLDEQDVDRVYLNLPIVCQKTQSKYELPKWLVRSSWNRLIINRTQQDYGPATKLIPTLFNETDSNTAILVCDDDYSYHPDWSNQYFERLKRGSFVCGNGPSTEHIEEDIVKIEDLNDSKARALRHLLTGRHFIFPEAFSGLALYADCLNPFELISASNKSKECYFSDDITIAYCMNKAGLSPRLIGLDKVLKFMDSKEHYGMLEWSLVSGQSGGNRHNYTKALLQLLELTELAEALKGPQTS